MRLSDPGERAVLDVGIFVNGAGENPEGWRNSNGPGEKGFACAPCRQGDDSADSYIRGGL